MDKRYQVFVSSTYSDLKEERQKVMHTLMDMNCIPVGMEFFPSIDKEQFAYIKRVIDDSDYYVVFSSIRVFLGNRTEWQLPRKFRQFRMEE